MSLWRYRRSIGAAVAGDLSGPAELKLRAHLRTCEPCRTHYNTLSELSAAGDPRTAAQRQRVRLEALLSSPQSPSERRARAWVWVLPVLVPAVLALLWLRPRSLDESVVWRGGVEPAVWPLSLVLYEFAQGAQAPPVVLGELPFSSGVRVTRDALVQLAYARLKRPTFVFIVGEQTGKHVVLYPRRSQDEGALVPEPRPKALGTSLKLHAAFAPGPLKLWVVTSLRPLTQAQAVEAIGAGRVDKHPGLQVFTETVRLLP